MRIALVILHADPARGGAERYTIDLAAALARRGHDVSLLASSFAGEIAGVNPITIPARGRTRAGRYRRFLAALDAHLDATKYDVVHAMLPVRRCDVYHPHAGIAAAAGRKWNRVFTPRRRLMAAVEHRLLLGERPPVTIALSEYVKRSIRAHYPLSEDRLATLFNAVDLQRFDPTTFQAVLERDNSEWLRAGAAEALIIANDYERKGLGEAIQALGRLREERVQLLVLGREDSRGYEAAARREGISDRVMFLGPVTDPRPAYDQADFFVLPTKHDPCSLVVLEALAMGLPVISTVFNGATEIMTDGVHGYVLTDPSDVDALADAMRKMLDPERRRAMSEACLALRPRLSYEHHVDELLRIYERARERP